jgi:signal transduction histidine kinase
MVRAGQPAKRRYYFFMKNIMLKRAKDYREALDSKAQFISLVSHELRTPLHAISEGVQVVLDGTAGVLNAQQREFLTLAMRNAERLSRLIDNILDLQKLEASSLSFEFKKQSINPVVREVEKTFAPGFRSKGVNLKLKLDESLPDIVFDREKILQVLTNLAGNALKFTEKGEVCVTTQRFGNAVRISVADTGIGIKKEDWPKLFKPFSRIHEYPDKKYAGTGLGLSIVKKIMDGHGGKVSVESDHGKGAVFSFMLPVLERRSAPAPKPRARRKSR